MPVNHVPETADSSTLGTAAACWGTTFTKNLGDGSNTVGTDDVITAVGDSHAKQHALDSTADHSGLSGASDGNLLASSSDGVPKLTGKFFDTDPTMNADSDDRIPTQKAVKEYVDIAASDMIWEFFFNNTASGIGSYYLMQDTPTGEAESTFSKASLATGNAQLVASFITDSTDIITRFLTGSYDAHFHAARTSGSKDVRFYFVVKEYKADTSEVTIMTSETSSLVTTKVGISVHATVATEYECSAGSKIVCHVYCNVVGAGVSTVDVAIYAEGTNDSHVAIATNTAILNNTYIRKSTVDANSILGGVSDNTPIAIAVAENRIVGRKAGGNLTALTGAEVAAIAGAVAYSYENNTAVAADPNVITTAENGKVFSNAGASALNCHSLPTAEANLEFTWYSPSSYGTKITAAANDKISFGDVATKDGGYIQLAQYAYVRLKTIEITQGSYDWYVLSWDGQITLETA